MAVFQPHTVRCACGGTVTVDLADSVNVRRTPELRAHILAGTFHRALCAACGERMTIEKPFYYTDFDRNVLFKVLPRGERHEWKKASRTLDVASAFIPREVADGGARTLRVLFGLDELREKLVAADAGFDDRVVELLKVLLVYEHPVLLKWSRLRLVLDGVDDTALIFTAAYEHDRRAFRLALPRALADGLAADPARLAAWSEAAHDAGVFALPDHWVNIWRWSPQPTALDRLRDYAGRLEQGAAIDTGEAAFRQMLATLPRGRHLPSWAKKDLRTLFDLAKRAGDQSLQDALFELRFGIELEDDWSTNQDLDDIDTLWDLLKALPETHVEGNTKIREIQLGVGESGGFYQPGTNDISIGSLELANRERFEDIVRHEVGHAVHEMHAPLVDDWLRRRFGWRVFDVDRDDEIDQWVALMGGWGGLGEQERRDVRMALRVAIGQGMRWAPGTTPSLPAGHPWHGPVFGPRLAFERTGANWFRNHATWHRAGGRAFFLNYWYRTLMAVDAEALALVGDALDSYAAMSHFEYFAELYALHYDLDDPRRTAIPEDVRDWIDETIGAPAGAVAMPAPPAAKQDWETATRPETRRRGRRRTVPA